MFLELARLHAGLGRFFAVDFCPLSSPPSSSSTIPPSPATVVPSLGAEADTAPLAAALGLSLATTSGLGRGAAAIRAAIAWIK